MVLFQWRFPNYFVAKILKIILGCFFKAKKTYETFFAEYSNFNPKNTVKEKKKNIIFSDFFLYSYFLNIIKIILFFRIILFLIIILSLFFAGEESWSLLLSLFLPLWHSYLLSQLQPCLDGMRRDAQTGFARMTTFWVAANPMDPTTTNIVVKMLAFDPACFIAVLIMIIKVA